MGLNVEQQRAVDCEDNLLVLAPPGSGKTGTLVEKARHILSKDPRASVLLVTFTDASAKEAKERLQKQLTPQQFRRISAATFHKHAMDQLRAAGKLGRLISDNESRNLVREALVEVGSTMDPREAEQKIQAYKSSPDFTGKEEDFVEAYEARKTSFRGIDLQDVIREAVNGMRTKNPEKRVPPLTATHVMCDEFQDVDLNQLHWLLCYFQLGAIVTVVGDDDQSVYSFRNSLGYDAMKLFIETVSPTVIHLEVNYRSRREILQSATALIRHNTKRMDKTIVSFLGDGGNVYTTKAADKEAEASMIVDAIISDAAARGYDLDKIPKQRWGIIARTNRDLWMIAMVLRSEGIPFVKSQKKDEAPKEIMQFCDLLVAIQTNDSLNLRNALSALGVNDRTIQKLHAQLKDSFFQIMDGELPGLTDLSIEDQTVLKPFLEKCPIWRELTAVGQYSRVIGAVGAYFEAAVTMHDEVKSDFRNVVDLLSGANHKHLAREGNQSSSRNNLRKRPAGNLQVRVLNFFRQEDNKGAGGVSLYTMHGSKGLEFDNVFIAECNSGTIPSAKSTSVEEERRLFFVAMTRAREELTMCSIVTKGASVFLSEIG